MAPAGSCYTFDSEDATSIINNDGNLLALNGPLQDCGIGILQQLHSKSYGPDTIPADKLCPAGVTDCVKDVCLMDVASVMDNLSRQSVYLSNTTAGISAALSNSDSKVKLAHDSGIIKQVGSGEAATDTVGATADGGYVSSKLMWSPDDMQMMDMMHLDWGTFSDDLNLPYNGPGTLNTCCVGNPGQNPCKNLGSLAGSISDSANRTIVTMVGNDQSNAATLCRAGGTTNESCATAWLNQNGTANWWTKLEQGPCESMPTFLHYDTGANECKAGGSLQPKSGCSVGEDNGGTPFCYYINPDHVAPTAAAWSAIDKKYHHAGSLRANFDLASEVLMTGIIQTATST